MNITPLPCPISGARIVGALGPYLVEAAHHELDLRDHSLHRLHHVRHRGLRSKCLRALQLEDKRTYSVFDITALATPLREDLCGTADRDVPGLVKFTLRGIYPTGHAMRRVVSEIVDICGVPEALAEPAARHADARAAA